MKRKILGFLVIAVLAAMVFTHPAGSADAVAGSVHVLTGAGSSLGVFFGHLFGGAS